MESAELLLANATTVNAQSVNTTSTNRTGVITNTYSKEEFRSKFSGKLVIIRSPKSGKLFLAEEGKSGSIAAISSKCDLSKPYHVIEITDGSNVIYSVCNIAEDNKVCDF